MGSGNNLRAAKQREFDQTLKLETLNRRKHFVEADPETYWIMKISFLRVTDMKQYRAAVALSGLYDLPLQS